MSLDPTCYGLSAALLSEFGKMPDSNNDLLKIIAASLLVGGGGSGVESGTTLSTDSVSLSADTATGITVPDGAKSATITAFDNNIIYRVDGGTAADNAGHVLLENHNVNLSETPLDNLSVISIGAAANLFITFFS